MSGTKILLLKKSEVRKGAMLLILVCIVTGKLFAQSLTNYQQALHFLNMMGETYFRIYLPTSAQNIRLGDMVSLDHVDFNRNEALAYANRQEFEEFLKLGFDYDVLINPSLTGPPPAMSDYADVSMPIQDWTKYPTYQGYLNLMDGFESKYPNLVKVHKIGESVKKRNLLVANVSNRVGVRDPEPKFLLCSGIHGDELLAVQNMLRLIDWLCSNYQKDPHATRILDSIDLWISPQLNPDGTYAGGDNTVMRSTRANANGVDLNRDYKRVPSSFADNTWSLAKAQVETQQYIAFEKKHAFVMQIGWHGGTEGISYPWSTFKIKHADDAWYNYVSRNYANQAQDDGPNGFFDDINNGAGQGAFHLYPAVGTEKDYLLYYHNIRSNCIEASKTKKLSESNLNKYWTYHFKATLAYIQEVLHGIRGTVTDVTNGVKLRAKVFVNNHDERNSHVYSDLPHGNFHRPIAKGTYSLTFSCDGCEDKTINNVVVNNGKATIVNAELTCDVTANNYKMQNIHSQFAIIPHKNGLTINFSKPITVFKASLYDMQGKRISDLFFHNTTQRAIPNWQGTFKQGHHNLKSGCYVLNLITSYGKVSKTYMQITN